MSVFEMPGSANIHGLNLRKEYFSPVFDNGTDFDKFELNRDKDIVIATYPRTGWSIMLLNMPTHCVRDKDYIRTRVTCLNSFMLFN